MPDARRPSPYSHRTTLLAAAVIALPWYYGGVTGMGQCALAVCVAVALAAEFLATFRSYHFAKTSRSDSQATPAPQATPATPATRTRRASLTNPNSPTRSASLTHPASPTHAASATALASINTKLAGILLGGMILGGLQLVPLGALQPWLAPTAHQWRAAAQDPSAGTDSNDGPAAVTTRSIYTAATRHCLGLLLVTGAACLLAMTAYSGERTAVALLIAGTISGVCLSLFGMAQALRGVNEPFGEPTLLRGAGSCFASYVNRNNAGGFLNLCLACSVGLVAWIHWRPLAKAGRQHSTRQASGHGAPAGLAAISGSQLLIWGATIIIAAGVMSTISRGSIVAFLVASILTLGLVRPWMGRGLPVWALVVLAAMAIALVAWLGRLPDVQKRFDDALAPQSASPLEDDGRWAIWKEGLATWTRFAVWGSGLETYGYAHLKQQSRNAGTTIAYHAENQFVQTLSDAGLIGFGLLLAAIAVVAAAVRRLAAASDRINLSLAVAGAFALVSQIVGGSFDFGLYIPANALLMALLCGAVSGRAASARSAALAAVPASHASSVGSSAARSAHELFLTNPWMRRAIYGLLCFGSVLAAWDAFQLSGVERGTSDALASMDGAIVDEAALNERIEQLTTAVSRRADDANGNYWLSIMWMDRFRLQMFTQFQRAQPWQDAEQLWPSTGAMNLLLARKELQDSGAETHALQRQIDVLQPTLDVVLAYANRAIRVCPWDARFHLHKASIELLMAKFSEAKRTIERAQAWSAGNPEYWYASGQLSFLGGDTASAQFAWQRCVQLSEQFASQIDAWRRGAGDEK